MLSVINGAHAALAEDALQLVVAEGLSDQLLWSRVDERHRGSKRRRETFGPRAHPKEPLFPQQRLQTASLTTVVARPVRNARESRRHCQCGQSQNAPPTRLFA